jgi:ATP-dependent protease HslVU (ClpYQ) ATPase subunit
LFEEDWKQISMHSLDRNPEETPSLVPRGLPKIVVIIGTTGVGKTKLSLEIAKHFQGEIIGADSMQLYQVF